jgi:hypothetical protein
MPCPFPGMDPYIERSAIWPDFHDRFVGIICGQLNSVVRPHYVAMTQERLYVVTSERPIRPDVSVVRTSVVTKDSTALATAEPDIATYFELSREEIREPYIEIIEPAAGNRVVTAIEVISPTNKQSPGRRSYQVKREELILGNANFVEIDLLHEGESVVRVSADKLTTLGRYHYLVAVTRQTPSRQEVYAVPLECRLPRVAIPLDADVPDVTLDLQIAFTRCWNEGPYPELLRYDERVPGTWSEAETAWLAETLRSRKTERLAEP